MPTAQSILETLKSRGNEKTRITYARHGMALERTLGVSVADLKLVAKTLRGEQALALELYDTGMMEAMYLAGMVAHGAKMSPEQLRHWAETSGGMQMIAEYTVPWVTVENAAASALATRWIASPEEHIASAGWSTLAGLVGIQPDDALDLAEIERLLGVVEAGVGSALNRVRYTMNAFVIAVGGYVIPLSEAAKATARRLGNVSVDVGKTACKVPVASEYIAKIEAMGRVGRKRKTLRC